MRSSGQPHSQPQLAGANGVTFLPFLAGARAPIWEPGATGTFHGLTAQTTRADLARASVLVSEADFPKAHALFFTEREGEL